METPPPPKRVSVGLPRRVLDVTMREYPSLFAGYKNVTHDVGGYTPLCYSLFAGYKNVTHDVGAVYMLNAVVPWELSNLPV